MSVEVFADSTDSLCVTVEKAGKLKKQLKEVNPTSINTLKIIGAINAKDMLELAPFTNIEKLYLDDAVYEIDDIYDSKRTVNFPSFKKLKTLYSFPKAKLKKEEKSYGVICEKMPSDSLDILAVGEKSYISKYKTKKLIIYPSSDVITKEGYFYGTADELFINEETQLGKHYLPLETPLILFKKGQDTIYIINKWKNSFPSFILHGEYNFANDAFQDTDIDSITIPKYVRTIPRECFEGCKNLKYVNLNNVERIEERAFYGCTSLKTINLKNVTYLGGSVFKKTSISHLTMPSSIHTINNFAFSDSHLRTIDFLGKYPPVIEDNEDHLFAPHMRIIVPTGSFEKYNKSVWRKFAIEEKDGNTKLDLNITEPGTLNQFIPNESCLKITELKISGKLYDIDLKAIEKCKNLRVLDLEKSFILTSPETLQRKKDSNKALLALWALAAHVNAKDAYFKLNAGKGNAVDAVLSQVLAESFNEALATMDDEEAEAKDECVSPVFNVPSHLEKFVYPRLLKHVTGDHDRRWESLKEVVFPPHAVSIQEKLFCSKIKDANIPKSVEVITGFDACKNLEVIDLSNTQVEILRGAFYRCDNIKIFKGSKTLKLCQNYFGRDYQIIGYFYTEEKPEMFDEKYFKEIHIPQGTKEGWKLADPRVRIIDDIVL